MQAPIVPSPLRLRGKNGAMNAQDRHNRHGCVALTPTDSGVSAPCGSPASCARCPAGRRTPVYLLVGSFSAEDGAGGGNCPEVPTLTDPPPTPTPMLVPMRPSLPTLTPTPALRPMGREKPRFTPPNAQPDSTDTAATGSRQRAIIEGMGTDWRSRHQAR